MRLFYKLILVSLALSIVGWPLVPLIIVWMLVRAEEGSI